MVTTPPDATEVLEDLGVLPPLPNPAPAAPAWTPGNGIPHPTGGYHDFDAARPYIEATSYYRSSPGRPVLHREDGPAIDGPRNREWWIAGKRHRLDGPAVEDLRPGGAREEWWADNVLHRLDGPAVVYRDEAAEYRVLGVIYTEEEHARLREALDAGSPFEWAVAYAKGHES